LDRYWCDLAMVRLGRRIPCLIPMHGLKISIAYSIISNICRNCLKFHKREIVCEKQKWLVYVAELKLDNPQILTEMIKASLEELDNVNMLPNEIGSSNENNQNDKHELDRHHIWRMSRTWIST
jgi:hypothetical protein